MPPPTAIDAYLAHLREMQARLFRLASAYADDDQREDLLQEMRLAIWNGWTTFRGGSKRSTWSYRVALNTALMSRRTASRRPATGATPAERSGGQDDAAQAAVLREFVRSLEPVDRAVFVLSLEGTPRDEMCETLGLSTNAISTRLSRMKARFRSRYIECDTEEAV